MPDALPLPKPSLTLASGRCVEVEPHPEERIVVRGSDGGVEVAIRFTPAGPVLEVSAVALQFKAQAEVAVQCRDFIVQAQRGVSLQAGELFYAEADDVAAVARTGDVELQAERDAVVRGERVRLNC
jgi:hypothetical protein